MQSSRQTVAREAARRGVPVAQVDRERLAGQSAAEAEELGALLAGLEDADEGVGGGGGGRWRCALGMSLFAAVGVEAVDDAEAARAANCNFAFASSAASNAV